MKETAPILATLLFFASSAPVFARITNDVRVYSVGEGSSASVKSSTTTTNGTTNINIHQTGEGTSRVTVNGKEWKLEGPGELIVNEGLGSTTPSSTPTQAPEPTNGNTSEETSTPTQSPTSTQSVESASTTFSAALPPSENNKPFSLKRMFDNFFNTIHNLFSNLMLK